MDLHDPGYMMFSAEVRQDQPIADARATLLATLDAAAGASPITPEEVERARTKILKNYELTLNNSQRVGMLLSEYIGQGDWRLFFLNRDRVRAATVDEVRAAAAAYLKPSNRTVGVFLPTARPDRAEIPPPPKIAALVEGYEGDAPLAAGEIFDPSPANIDSRTRRSELPGGMKLALLSKETRGDTVVGIVTLRFGNLEGLAGKATSAELAADMLMRGTKQRSRQDIQDALDRLKARVAVTGGGGQAVLSFETTRPNLPEVLRLAAEVLREPAFPEAEFEKLRQEYLAWVEQQKSDPNFLGSNLYERHMSPYPAGDVRHVDSLEEAFAAYRSATLGDAVAFHRDFYGASNGQMAVVGDFAEEEIAALAAELFGNWKSPAPYARIPNPFHDVPPLHESVLTPDKESAYFVAGQNLKLRDDDPDYPALVLGNFMLGSSDTNRLYVRIREKDGLSYGVGSDLSASPIDESGEFTAAAISAPQNTARVEAAFREELARALKDGFAAKEIADAKSGWLQSRQTARAQDMTLARTLANYLYLGRTMAWSGELDRKVQALSGEQVLAAMRRHIDPAKMSVVKAGDFHKQKAAP
jgi:zinc protease